MTLSDFAFAIGDTVQHVAWRAQTRATLFILERRRHECAGGVQKEYLCRQVFYDHRSGVETQSTTMWLSEGELIAAP